MVNHRVVVQLTDIDADIPNRQLKHSESTEITLKQKVSNKLSLQSVCNNIGIDIEIMKDNSVEVDSINIRNKNTKRIKQPSRSYHQMNFDSVDRGTNFGLRNELIMLFNKLFIEHKNSCVMIVQMPRECPWTILDNEILGEIDKRINKGEFTLENIKVEYFDVRKFDVMNMLERVYTTSNGLCGRQLKPCKHFNSIQQLRKWIQTEFLAIFFNGSGHDFIDLHITFYDTQRFIYKVKLSLVHIYLNRMDSETRDNLRSFFETLGTAIGTKECLLTSFLKDFFCEREPCQTLMVFQVLTKNTLPNIIREMFRLAHASYLGAKALEERKLKKNNTAVLNNLNSIKNTEIFPNKRDYLKGIKNIPSSLLTSSSSSKASIGPSTRTTAITAAGKYPSSRSERQLTSSKKHLTKSKLSSLTSMHCKPLVSHNVFDNLSVGYRTIDDKFMKVIETMKNFYVHKCNAKALKICNDISIMTRTIDFNTDSSNINRTNNATNAVRKMQRVVYLYQEALSSFRNLYKDINRSLYSCQLKTYMNTKNYEINQQELQLRVQQLMNCQSQLSGIIKNEVDALKTKGAVAKQMSKLNFVI